MRTRRILPHRRSSGTVEGRSSVARLYLARDVVECPECGEPEPFLGIFLRQGKGAQVRLSRLEWITHAPPAFAKWVARASRLWRRAHEIYVNHCSSCGSLLADPLGFRKSGGWLCDTGIDVAVSAEKLTVSVEGFSPGAVVLPDGAGLWEEALRITPRDFRRRFRDLPRFAGERSDGLGLYLHAAAPPHRWRLAEGRGKKLGADDVFFSFSRAKEVARVRYGVPPSSWRADV